MHPLKVFISSTCYDLKEIRSGLATFLSDTGYHPVFSEHRSFPIDPNIDTVANCINNVEDSDIFILIIGLRYGYTLQNGKSITNMEYIYAKKQGIPVFVFISDVAEIALREYRGTDTKGALDLVDDIKIYEFIEEIKLVNKEWCYTYAGINDITDNLRIRFSHLFSKSLEIRSKMLSDDRAELWNVISPKATALAIMKAQNYEILFLHQVLRDEFDKHKERRFDLEYEVFLNDLMSIESCKETKDFLVDSFNQAVIIVNSASNILNVAFKVFWGEPGTPADLFGLYYIANRLSKVYLEMINWAIRLKSTSVPEYFSKAKSLSSEFINLSAEVLWNYPDSIKLAIDDGLSRLEAGELNVTVKGNITFSVDEKITNDFMEEMRRLTHFFEQRPDLYN